MYVSLKNIQNYTSFNKNVLRILKSNLGPILFGYLGHKHKIGWMISII